MMTCIETLGICSTHVQRLFNARRLELSPAIRATSMIYHPAWEGGCLFLWESASNLYFRHSLWRSDNNNCSSFGVNALERQPISLKFCGPADSAGSF
jgi:hypothetical protein